ncbi:MAG: TetR family transcriptional regulator [Deltaproteobacteria bacterium]|nr:TetR family transcriptional regulator [Nannocystaceae bacterium]
MPTAKAKLTPRRSPIQGRSRATVDAIVQATARVLVRRGWSGLTTNHVAEKAGVSVGTLYEYFPGKDALARALVERHLAHAEALLGGRLAALLAATNQFDVTTLARAMVDAMIELHENDPRLHRVLFEQVPHDASVRARVQRLEDEAAAVLARVLPHVRGVTVREPEIAARLVVELLEALTHRWITSRDRTPIPAPRMAEELTRLLVAYLTSA